MYSSSLSTHRFVRILHCSKQCYSSWNPWPFSSCAGFTFTISTDGKWVPFSTLFTLVYGNKLQGAKSANNEDVQIFHVFIGKKLLEQKGVVSWGIVLPVIRALLPQICHTVSLLIPTMSTIIFTLRRRSLRTISLIFWISCSVFEVEGWSGC